MGFDLRRLGIALAGFCAFLNLYAPQSVLPELSQVFHATAGEVSLTITASTLAVAFMAPFTGTFADVIGRKRVIVVAMFALVVPTALVGLSPSMHWLVFWRFAQGLVLPPIFAVAVAYVFEEWRGAEAVAVTGIYTSASGFGGFFGRLITGAVSDLAGWRIAFLSLAGLTLLLAIAVALLLAEEQRFVRTPSLGRSALQMLQHVRNPTLVATYTIGFGVLFTFIATFTYVNFHLAGPPYNLSATALGAIFVVYLGGSVAAPMAGRAVAQFGRRPLVLLVVIFWIAGLLLTLLPSLAVIVAGLAISATCGFMCQTLSTSYVGLCARAGASSAVGLYVTWYYVGGSVGGALPGAVWSRAGWPGCVGLVIVVLLLIALLAWRFWDRPTAVGT
jgi:MFS transporter, YNFM family, putative membrane transport protein